MHFQNITKLSLIYLACGMRYLCCKIRRNSYRYLRVLGFSCGIWYFFRFIRSCSSWWQRGLLLGSCRRSLTSILRSRGIFGGILGLLRTFFSMSIPTLKYKRDELISIRPHHSYSLWLASATPSNSTPYKFYNSKEWKASNLRLPANSPKQENQVAQSEYDYHRNHVQ